MVKYLDSIHDLVFILHYDGSSLARWYADAYFVVHNDLKSQSQGRMTLSDTDRAIASGNNKQKLNTHSSIEYEVFAANGFLPKILD